jgi:hypothetical protein
MWSTFFASTALPMDDKGASLDTIAICVSEAVFNFLEAYVKVRVARKDVHPLVSFPRVGY